MHFHNVFDKNFLFESIFLNSINWLYFNSMFIFFPFCINLLVLKIKSKKNSVINNYTDRNNIYFVLKNDVVFRTKKEYLRSFITFSTLLMYNKINNLCIRTIENNSFIISITRDKSLVLGPHVMSVIYGSDKFGQGEILTIQNNIIYSHGYNSISLGIIMVFPYTFVKKIEILKGINFIINIKINPVLLVYTTKFGKMQFFQISCKDLGQFLTIFPIGSFKVTETSYFLWDILVSKNVIFIANSEYNYIRTWKITLDINMEIKNFQTCGFVHAFNDTILSFLYWGGMFYNFLFTGGMDGKLIIWNELLIPILKINISGSSILDSKLSPDFSGFVLVFRKDCTQIHSEKKDRCIRYLPQTTLKIYTNWKKNGQNLHFIINKLYFLSKKLEPNSFFDWKIFLRYSEKFKKNTTCIVFIVHFILSICDKIKSKEVELQALVFCYKFLKHKCWANIFFDKKSFFLSKRKELLFQLFKIGKIRNLSLIEIEIGELISLKRKFSVFYRKCDECNRISKFQLMHQSGKIFCLFSHDVKKKFFYFLSQYKPNSLKNFKLDLDSFGSIPNDETPKFLSCYIINYLVIQREFIWAWKDIAPCNILL
nr:hypothetical protein 1634Bnrm1_p037 [Cryptomonas sp.]